MKGADPAPALAADIAARADGQGRYIVGVAGPPGAGKSSLARALVMLLDHARIVPMDGFHYDNAVLEARGLLPRKGAPETFDAHGFLHLLTRLRQPGDVAIPVFDREADLSRAGADVVTDQDRILIVEGNYLLLDQPPWDRLRPIFDLTVFIDVPEAELERRLIRRWRRHGHKAAEARARALGNDIPNAKLVIEASAPADIVIGEKGQRAG